MVVPPGPGRRALLLAALLFACTSTAPPREADAPVAATALASHPCTERACLEAAVETLATSGIRLHAGADIGTDERLAFEAARPVFERYCLRCHSQGSKKVKPSTLARLDMTAYPFGSAHGDRLALEIRGVIGLDGGPPTMPMVKPGCLGADDMDRVAAWAEAFDRARAATAR